MPINWKPENSQTAVPYIAVKGVAEVLAFAKDAFGAVETEHMNAPDGSIMHAEIKIDDTLIMLGDPGKESDSMRCMLYVYVPDADAAYQKALNAGAVSIREPKDEFYGHRCAAVKDSAGNMWWIATLIDIVPQEELQRRVADAVKQR